MECEAEAESYSKFKRLAISHTNPLEDQEEEEEEDRNRKLMAESGSSENGSDAKLCANNCGFYGTPKNRNLCSVCYAASLKETGEEGDSALRSGRSRNLSAKLKEIEDEESDQPSSSASESTTNSGSEATGLNNPAAKSKSKSRCGICKKKVGLLGFNCRCGGLFCGGHRYPEEHSCDVDRKAIGRQTLANQLVECKPDKLEFRV